MKVMKWALTVNDTILANGYTNIRTWVKTDMLAWSSTLHLIMLEPPYKPKSYWSHLINPSHIGATL